MKIDKCPICGKQGIPDYTHEDVVCPHCGSDLRIYHSLNCLFASSNKKFKGTLFALVILMVVLLIGSTVLIICQDNSFQAKISYQENSIYQLKDSISELHLKIEKVQNVNDDYIYYVVVKNDSPWKIVGKLYGIGSQWQEIAQEIAEDNGIWDESTKSWKQIHPGQILKVRNDK